MAEIFHSQRKRSRTEESSTNRDSCGNHQDIERVTIILDRLSNLCNEFPELQFIIDYENLKTNVETAVENYAKDAKKPKVQHSMYQKEETLSLNSLPDEVLQNCLSFVVGKVTMD